MAEKWAASSVENWVSCLVVLTVARWAGMLAVQRAALKVAMTAEHSVGQMEQ